MERTAETADRVPGHLWWDWMFRDPARLAAFAEFPGLYAVAQILGPDAVGEIATEFGVSASPAEVQHWIDDDQCPHATVATVAGRRALIAGAGGPDAAAAAARLAPHLLTDWAATRYDVEKADDPESALALLQGVARLRCEYAITRAGLRPGFTADLAVQVRVAGEPAPITVTAPAPLPAPVARVFASAVALENAKTLDLFVDGLLCDQLGAQRSAAATIEQIQLSWTQPDGAAVAQPANPPTNYQWRWFADRLADPGLMAGALRINHDWAVPVGGARRGGYVFTHDAEEAEALVEMLAQIEGFPQPRVEDDSKVLWGEGEPSGRDVEAMTDREFLAAEMHIGRMYGYSRPAIRAHLTRGAMPSALVDDVLDTVDWP